MWVLCRSYFPKYPQFGIAVMCVDFCLFTSCSWSVSARLCYRVWFSSQYQKLQPMVGWPQIPGPVVRHLGSRLGGTDLLNSRQLDRSGWWQKGARASVSYPLNACPTDLPRPVSFLLPQPPAHQSSVVKPALD